MDDPPLQRMASQMDRGTPDGAAFLNTLSDEEMALFAEALAIQRELEAEDASSAGAVPPDAFAEDEERLARAINGKVAEPAAPAESVAPAEEEPIAGVVPMRRPARKAVSRFWMGLAAAAVIAAIATPFMRRADQAVRGPSQAVALLANPDRTLPPDIDVRTWGGTRGSGDVAAPSEDAVRAGAFVVDLEVAIRSGDAAQASLFAERAAGVLERLGTRGPEAAGRFRELGARASTADREALLADLAAATEAAERALDRDRFTLGAWAEAARIAARHRDAAFFRSDRTRATLDRAERIFGQGEARAAIDAIRAALQPDPPAWAELQAGLEDLFQAIA